ncbi:hypothetical protein ACFWY9_37505 [Amycolatopsis sp. NPDC059027]|uniref:hypothetical protein n=1 Tax=unclassified Amycolatopsis TaxID=2618356 RepID=UPI0036732611
MDENDDIRTVLSSAASGPPMRFDAADVIARGGRIRRRRKRWAMAGSSAATAVILVVAGFMAGHHLGADPAPIQPAGPGLSTVPSSPSSPVPAPEQATSPERQSVPEQPNVGTATPGAPGTSVPKTSQRLPGPTPTRQVPGSAPVPTAAPGTERTTR